MDSPLESLVMIRTGTGDPLLDRTGLMSEDPSIDRGDELFRGRGAKVAVLDFSFWRGHEDIERIEMEVTPNGRVVPRLDANDEEIPTITWSRDTEARYLPRKPYVIVEKGVTMVTIPEIGYPDHGTAVLGQLSALDEARDWGEKLKESPELFPKPSHTSLPSSHVKMATGN